MKETTKHRIKYPEGTDLVRNAAQQFEAMAQSIDDNIDDLPDTITQKVTAAQTAAEQAAADAKTYSGQTQTLQDAAVALLISGTGSTASALFSRADRVFDTVAAMKAVKLSNGMSVRTRGWYAVGDGGGTQYRVTDTSTGDLRSIAVGDGLYATVERVTGDIRQLGAQAGDDVGPIVNLLLKLVKTAYIPTGKWMLGTTIMVADSQCSIRGDGMNLSLLVAAKGMTAPMIQNQDTAGIDQFSMHGIGFVKQDATAFDTCMVRLYNGLYVTIDSCRFETADGTEKAEIQIGGKSAGWSAGTNVAKITGCRFHHAALTVRSYDSVIVNNEIWASGIGDITAALTLNGATNTLVMGNMLVGTGFKGGLYMIGASGSRVIGNYFDGSGDSMATADAISVHSCARLTIADNHMWRIKGCGLYAERMNTSNIQGNMFEDCDYWPELKNPDVKVVQDADNSSFSNNFVGNYHWRKTKADTTHASNVERDKASDPSPAYDVWNYDTNGITVITANHMYGNWYYAKTVGHSTAIKSMNNNDPLFSPQTNGVTKLLDVGSTYNQGGKVWFVDASGTPRAIATI